MIIIRIIFMLIMSLFHLEELSQCAAPMHVFFVGEWVGIILAGLLLVGESLRFGLGEYIGIPLIVVVIIWNIVGTVMFFITESETPECIPRYLVDEMWFFFIIFAILSLFAIFQLFIEGISFGRRAWHNQFEAQQNIDNLVNGNVRANQLVAHNRNNTDGFSLFANEMEQLERYCSVEYTGQSHDEEDTQCIICMENFVPFTMIILYPVCKHRYHKDCLWEWLRTKTTCPMCRRGIRSSLYQEIDNSHRLLS